MYPLPNMNLWDLILRNQLPNISMFICFSSKKEQRLEDEKLIKAISWFSFTLIQWAALEIGLLKIKYVKSISGNMALMNEKAPLRSFSSILESRLNSQVSNRETIFQYKIIR